MEEEENKKYGLIITIIIAIGVILLICLPLKNTDVKYEEVQTNYIIVSKDRIELGEPKYVNYEEINTSDRNLEKENNSKYSQISVKNTSNETLYSISITLREQETNEPSIISPSYNIEILKPGETAILSAKHGDINGDKSLILDFYSYMDGTGTLYTVTETTEDGVEKLGVHSEKDVMYYKYNNITSDIKKISIEDIRKVEESNRFYYEIDIKNVSNEELKDVNVTLREYLDGNVIGNLIEGYSYALKPAEEITLNVEVKKDVKVEVDAYSYRTTNSSEYVSVFTNYIVYEDEGLYYSYEYEDNDAINRKNTFMVVINIIIVFVAWQMERYAKKLKEKGELEDNEAYTERAIVVNRIKDIINIAYVLIIILTIYLSTK
ncbi:MAG: hypothetical protein ACRC92_08345 [Peptostreptococcaceae bacterium]